MRSRGETCACYRGCLRAGRKGEGDNRRITYEETLWLLELGIGGRHNLRVNVQWPL